MRDFDEYDDYGSGNEGAGLVTIIALTFMAIVVALITWAFIHFATIVYEPDCPATTPECLRK